MDMPPEEAREPRGATTHSLLKTIRSTLEVADLMALLMVLATTFSAYATWKTAQVTNEILLTSQRPYIGTESVKFADGESSRPRVMADLRNFGSVQAENATISIGLSADGKALADNSGSLPEWASVVLSPSVPHSFYRHITPEIHRDAAQGKIHLMVEIRVRYRGPRGDQHCYLNHFAYDHLDDIFYSTGGSISCNH